MRHDALKQACLPNTSVLILAELLSEQGVDADRLLADCGLRRTFLDDREMKVTGLQELHVQRAFMRTASGDPGLMVEAGRRYRMLSYSPWGLALATAPSFREMLRINDRFSDINYTLSRFVRIEQDGSEEGMQLDFSLVPEDLITFVQTRDAVAFTTFLHDLWNGCFPFVRIELPLPIEAYAGFDFRAPVVPDTGRARWFWSKDVFDRALPLSDSTLHRHYLRESEALLSRSVDALLGAIDTMLDDAEISFSVGLPMIARALNMSQRTLQRELAARDVSYRMLIDKARRRRAERLLAQTARSIAEIAETLGYANISSFYQAFRRWTALSPAAFRAQCSASSRKAPSGVYSGLRAEPLQTL